MRKAVILLSGGLDSTTCLAVAKAQGFQCYALSFDYGQRHVTELAAAATLAAQFNCAEHRVVKLDMGQFGGSALTDSNINVPRYENSNDIPLTYVPARNTTFLAIALGYAEVIEAYDIFIGVSAVDYSNYPDCRPEFIKAFQHTANLGTKAGDEGQRFVIHTPLINLSKAQTIQLGIKHGVNYAQTVSCYQLNAMQQACGSCPSCVLRRQGFVAAGIDDPTPYHLNNESLQ